MAKRAFDKLGAIEAAKLRALGCHSDGGGLYRLNPSGRELLTPNARPVAKTSPSLLTAWRALPALLWRRGASYFRFPRAIRAADCVLASYPKSGRTWLRFILSNYFNLTADLRLEVDLHTMFCILPNLAMDNVRGMGAFRFKGTIPLILVGHFDYKPRLLRGTPIIFLIRDPRDVLVSDYFHATRHKHRFAGSIGEFLDSQYGIDALVRYLNAWAAGLHSHRNLVISYEQLMTDPVDTTIQALKFLGCAIDLANACEAVERSRFEVMRAGESRTGIPDHHYDRSDREALRMRRGKVGGFIDYLSSTEIDRIEAELTANLSPEAKAVVGCTGLRLG